MGTASCPGNLPPARDRGGRHRSVDMGRGKASIIRRVPQPPTCATVCLDVLVRAFGQLVRAVGGKPCEITESVPGSVASCRPHRRSPECQPRYWLQGRVSGRCFSRIRPSPRPALIQRLIPLFRSGVSATRCGRPRRGTIRAISGHATPVLRANHAASGTSTFGPWRRESSSLLEPWLRSVTPMGGPVVVVQRVVIPLRKYGGCAATAYCRLDRAGCCFPPRAGRCRGAGDLGRLLA